MGTSRLLILTMLALPFAPVGASAAAERFEGLRLEIPDGWTLKDHAKARRDTLALSSAADVDLLGRVWQWNQAGSVAAKLTVSSHALPIRVDRFGVSHARRRLESALGDVEGIESFEVHDVSVVDLNGRPAYRIRACTETAEERIEHLQYVVCGGRTYVIGFSTPVGDYARWEPSFEKIAGTLIVNGDPPLLCQSTIWFWGGLWGTVLGVGLALRERLGNARARRASLLTRSTGNT